MYGCLRSVCSYRTMAVWTHLPCLVTKFKEREDLCISSPNSWRSYPFFPGNTPGTCLLLCVQEWLHSIWTLMDEVENYETQNPNCLYLQNPGVYDFTVSISSDVKGIKDNICKSFVFFLKVTWVLTTELEIFVMVHIMNVSFIFREQSVAKTSDIFSKYSNA